jgi:hypothetical protein
MRRTKTELDQFNVLLDKYGIKYSLWMLPNYICDEAVKRGCTVAISVRDEVDFHFNKKGELIGTSTNYQGSFDSVKRKRKARK